MHSLKYFIYEAAELEKGERNLFHTVCEFLCIVIFLSFTYYIRVIIMH